jgi:prepilin-type N-terminal cleavage/methylation domain-containing protein/prepilin-type processing-associated H-X9-DG protein
VTARRAFTLIELLVVIAIIAVLAAILFPVFTRAKASAKSAQCLSNMKQYGHACLLYLTDYDETYPQSVYSLDNRILRGFSNDRVFTAYDATLPYLKNVQIAVCPVHRPPIDLEAITRRLRLRTTGQIRYFSYAINFALFQDPALGGGVFGDGNVVKSTALAFPADTIMYYDARLVSPPDFPPVPGCPRPRGFFFTWDNFSGDPRHADGVNISFTDGRARFVPRRFRLPGTSREGCPESTRMPNLRGPMRPLWHPRWPREHLEPRRLFDAPIGGNQASRKLLRICLDLVHSRIA